MTPVSELEPTSTKTFLKYFEYFGVHLYYGNLKYCSSKRSVLVVIAGFIQMILSIWLSIQRWNNINIRVAAFTTFGEYSISTLALGHLVIYPEYCTELFSLIDIPLDNFSKFWNSEQLYIRNDANRRAKRIQKLYFAAGITLWLFTNFVPCIIEIGKLMVKPLENISKDELLISFYFIPYLTSNTVLVYCALSLVQSFLYLVMITMSAFYYSVVTTAIKILEAEVKILGVSIKVAGDNVNNLMKSDGNFYDSSNSTHKILKQKLNYLI